VAKRSRTPSITGDDFPKYSIATASDMLGIHPQQLRRYEQAGIVVPQRTQGNTRRYSDSNLQRLGRIRTLAERGVNQKGIEQMLLLQDALQDAEEQVRVAEEQAQYATTLIQNAKAEIRCLQLFLVVLLERK
jgi:DNA-binding transcriptional MerR regulator